MSKNCVMCNKKIGFFEKLYEGQYCRECYDKQMLRAQQKIELENERKKAELEEYRKKKEQEEIENRLKHEKAKQEKNDYIKKYFLYDMFFYSILLCIDMLPFHYSSTFKSTIKNKFDIIKLLLDAMIEQLPKDYALEDIKKLTTYRKSALIISKTLQPHAKVELLMEKFYSTQINIQKYSNNPNNNVLDDTEHDTILLHISTFIDLQNMINYRINSYIDLNKNIDSTIADLEKKANQPKYDYGKCMNLIKEYDNEENFYIMYMYYDLAIIIVYYIYLNKEIDKIINTNELYKIYLNLKKEIHNSNYIVEKMYPIYTSLYKKNMDINIDTKQEFQYVIEEIKRRELIEEKNDYININESILNVNLNQLIKETDDEELINSIVSEIVNNFIVYQKNVTLDEVFNTVIYNKKHMAIFNKVKEQQAIYEKERILNGNFEEEKKLHNDLLDYSNITNGYDFEAYISNLYSLLGYEIVNLTSKSGDQGADVIVKKDDLKYAVQVKFYNNPVGNKAIQEVVAAMNFYKTDKAIVVTNSSYTKSAQELAKANDVILIDGNELDKLINQVKK